VATVRFGLKTKVLFGFALLFLSVLLAFGYGALTFHRLEGRMVAVNEVHVPAMRALNQIENSFFLLESDLDKSLGEGILRPKDTLENVIISRLDLLDRINREAVERLLAKAHQLGNSRQVDRARALLAINAGQSLEAVATVFLRGVTVDGV
jgi:hypothetical protein